MDDPYLRSERAMIVACLANGVGTPQNQDAGLSINVVLSLATTAARPYRGINLKRVDLDLVLPSPWANKEHFKLEQLNELTWLVGPNGSGKSRFSELLKRKLQDVRFLGADRLHLMAKPFTAYGDQFSQGLNKDHRSHFQEYAKQVGDAIETFFILEERMDVRAIVEATLSSLFSRRIRLDWESGRLVPKIVFDARQTSYRADHDECHGIKELLVLLTHIHDPRYRYLIIDEPELNLHPQYQSFLIEQIRRATSGATRAKDAIILITHSPYILDLRSYDDLASVISFSADHSIPRQVTAADDAERDALGTLTARLNAHNKQLFFSDNPVFVEGIHDARFVEAVQNSRRVSISAAGSCIIEAGGNNEVTKYLRLCNQLRKKAFFVYDLDSLFSGTLRSCIGQDGEVRSFLAEMGLGTDFSKCCGGLEKALSTAIEQLEKTTTTNPELIELKTHIQTTMSKADAKSVARSRYAMTVGLTRHRGLLIGVLGDTLVADIEGRLGTISKALREKNVLLLRGGALENYLPNYCGSPYAIEENQKQSTVETELEYLALHRTDSELSGRYGDLFSVLSQLPTRTPVDLDATVKDYATQYVHYAQRALVKNPSWGKDELVAHMKAIGGGYGSLFSIGAVQRTGTSGFNLRIGVAAPFKKLIRVTEDTNAALGKFDLETPDAET